MKKSTNIGISITVALLLAAVFLLRGTPNQHPDSLATESPTPNEDAAIRHAVARLSNQSTDKPLIKPKYHGCLYGNFSVISNPPPSFQSELFSPGTSYAMQIRFSAHHGGRPDTSPNMQAMAIKLFGVPGEKLANHSAPDTHDFLLASHPVLFSSDLESYLDGLEALQNGKPRRYFYNPANLQIDAYQLAKNIFTAETDLTTMKWWSMVPYKFNEGQAVKYSIRPCQIDRQANGEAARNYGQGTTPNFLRERLAETVNNSPLCYEFSVQLQSDPKTMPIEDPTISWDDALAPFQPIALMTIPAQDINAADQQQICRALKFHPWQVLPAHQPLGGINRARRVIYDSAKNSQ